LVTGPSTQTIDFGPHHILLEAAFQSREFSFLHRLQERFMSTEREGHGKVKSATSLYGLCGVPLGSAIRRRGCGPGRQGGFYESLSETCVATAEKSSWIPSVICSARRYRRNSLKKLKCKILAKGVRSVMMPSHRGVEDSAQAREDAPE